MKRNQRKIPATDKSNPTARGRVKRQTGALDSTVRQLKQDLTSVRETSQLLTGPMDLQQVLESVVKTVAQAIGADAAGLRLLDPESGELVLKATYGLSDTYINKGLITAGESTLDMRALGGEAVVVEDMGGDANFGRYHNDIVKEGLICNLTIGLIYREKGIGILRLYNKRQRTFSAADISTAQIVASQSAAAITNARLYAEALEGERMARQVRMAGEVQRRLIPKNPPDLSGVTLAGIYDPCQGVGGDFYDFIELPEGRRLITIGDVMGKGLPASLNMASLRAGIRAYAEQAESLHDLIVRANRLYCHDTEPWEFVTLFCAELDSAGAALTYCNCGHEPALLIRQGHTLSLQEGGTVIGLNPNSAFETRQIELEPQDMLVMYTDGLADAANFDHETFGRKRITEAALASADMTAEQAAKNILWLMRKFAGLTDRCDDTAIVILKKSPQ